MIDAYITTTGERWTVDNDGAMCLADKSGVAAYLIDDQRIYAELRALRAQRDKLLAASLRVVDWNGLNDPLTFDEVLDNLRAIAKEEA